MKGHFKSTVLASLLMMSPSILYAQTQSETLDLKEVKQQEQQVLQKQEAEASGGQTKESIEGEAAIGVGGEVEKLEVTGSHIKRINIEGPSPITVIDREDLDRTGYNSVADVLRDQTSSSFGGMKEDSGSNASGVAHVNLRGMGSSKTLVLLNGERLPSDAVTGAVDLNLIPMGAVDSVQILKDGASATYGSDALGGVVNIITKKDFTGSEVTLKQTQNEFNDGAKMEVSLVNGINKGKLRMVNTLYHRKNEVVFDRDRSWSNEGVSTIGSPGSYRTGGGAWQADPNCAAGDIQNAGANQYCSFKFSDFSTALPELMQTSMMSETTYSLREGLDLKLRVSATNKQSEWQYAPAPDVFTVADYENKTGNDLPGVNPGDNVDFRYRLVELGNRETEIESNAFNILTGVEGEMFETWTWKTNLSLNRVYKSDKGVNGYALRSKLTSLIDNGQFDPAAQAGSRGNLASAAYQPEENTMSELASYNLVASGEVGEIYAGPVNMAVGMTLTHEEFEDNFDEESVAGNVFGNAGSSGAGQRDVSAVFTEFAVPLHSTLEMQLAARHDRYSDFGSTTNPKLAFRWQPSKELLFRASAGTGFKAPLLVDMYSATSNGFPTFIDHKKCAEDGGVGFFCQPLQYNVVSSGNVGLKEEKSLSYNIGTVIQPSKLVSLSVDGWWTRLDNVVGIDYGDMTKAERDGIDVSKSGIIVDRAADGSINQVTAPLQNLSAQDIHGIDVGLEVGGHTPVGRLSLGSEYSHLIFFKEEGFPGTGLRETLLDNGRPAWRNTTTLTYAPTLNAVASVVARTTGAHYKAVRDAGRLKQYTEYDLQYKHSLSWGGVITAGAKNIFGETPPLDETNPNLQLDVDLYSQLGSTYYLSYKQNF